MIHPKHFHPEFENRINYYTSWGYRPAEQNELPENHQEIIGASVYMINTETKHIIEISASTSEARTIRPLHGEMN